MNNNNPLRIKLFSLSIILILINILPTSCYAFDLNDREIFDFSLIGNTIYVDDNYNSSIPGWGEDRFNKVQLAIDKASDGDTIIVYNGTYFENVLINKSINLSGENKHGTIIDSSNSGRVIRITKNGVFVSGFTLTNSGNYVEDSGVYIESYNNYIHDNIILQNQNGFYIKDSKSNRIIYNTIQDNNYAIYLINSDFNFLVENIIEDNKYGVYIQESSANDINGNVLENNEIGLWLKLYCTDNSIAGNMITRNTNLGFLMDRFCYNNIIHNNNFIKNKIHASFTMSFLNNWHYNYWDNWIGLIVEEYRIFPKGIFGQIFGPIPWINFDLYPLYEPYST